MTQFESISVAVSLVLALAAMVLLVACMWLATWNLNLRGISWDGLSLVYILVNPGLLTIQARHLTDSDRDAVDSFRKHFRTNPGRSLLSGWSTP